MREGDIDIVDLIMQHIPEQTEEQMRIKLYIQSHKSRCNEFIYSKFSRETTFFNTILKSLICDLGAEIVRVIYK